MKEYDIKKRTFLFALQTLKMCKNVAESNKEFVITRQLSRSSTSVGANVREARNSVSKNDFIYRLSIAQKECDESIYWLELLKDFISDKIEGLDELHKESEELMKILTSIIIKTKANVQWQNDNLTRI